MESEPAEVIPSAQEELISEQWYGILRAEGLKKRPVSLRRLGRELVLWRDGEGVAHCADAACPHRGANLGLGRLVEGQLECPYHGFRFASDGRCTLMPCEGKDARIPQVMCLKKHIIREENGFLWFWYGSPKPSLPPIPWVPGALVKSVGSVATEMVWNIRYSRVIEGMVDLHHFPFAHRRYSPPGYTRLDPYEVEVEGNLIRTRGTLRKEDPSASKGFSFTINIAFPGMIQVKFAEKVEGIALCTPIDQENTWIVIRYHQKYITLPILGKLFSWLLATSELRLIQPDDYRMLHSSTPRTSVPAANHFIRADRGAAAWHRLRQACMDTPDRARRERLG